MGYLRITLVLLVGAAAGACGGGNSSPARGAMTYAFVTPAVGATRLYSEAITDNSNNTIDRTLQDSVLQVNPDGSYAATQEDPSHQTIIVNGTNYSITTETVDADATGHVTSYSYVNPAGTTIQCSESPHGSGPPFPLSVGMNWSVSYTLACSTGSSVAYTQSGTVVDLESVTVPAGTYSALKLQSTITWTDGHGTTHEQSITNWRDTATSISVRELIQTTYSGTLPSTGYPVSNTIVLQSRG